MQASPVATTAVQPAETQTAMEVVVESSGGVPVSAAAGSPIAAYSDFGGGVSSSAASAAASPELTEMDLCNIFSNANQLRDQGRLSEAESAYRECLAGCTGVVDTCN
jgi:hypothetical protein